MIGAIIGDIVGSKFEFNNTFDYNFKLFDYGCSFTDDTICTIAIADAILNAKDGMPSAADFKTSLLKWCRLCPHPMGGYGCGFSNWLTSKNPQPYDSFGNGAAMRVSPIGFAYNDTSVVIREAMESAKVSHSHTEGLIGASVVALLISELRTASDKNFLIHRKMMFFYGDDWVNNLPKKGEFNETCQGCVPLAFDIVLQSKSFEDAIRRAVSYGGDSDTLGAIVGSIAEAYFGVPTDLEEIALSYLPIEMKNVYYNFIKRYGNK